MNFNEIIINLPLTDINILTKLKSGDKVLINGIMYIARDSAHKKIIEMINKNEELPFEIRNAFIYYAGPTPGKNKLIGSCGPTTSYRMDKFTPTLLKKGLKGMIGKGKRSNTVRKSIKDNKAIYFSTFGGAGALLGNTIISAKVIAFEDLGPEALFEIKVKNFPVIVEIDTMGNNIFLK